MDNVGLMDPGIDQNKANILFTLSTMISSVQNVQTRIDVNTLNHLEVLIFKYIFSYFIDYNFSALAFFRNWKR